MRKILVYAFAFIVLLVVFLLILWACQNESSERLETPETTQEETVPEETVEQYDLPRTGGIELTLRP